MVNTKVRTFEIGDLVRIRPPDDASGPIINAGELGVIESFPNFYWVSVLFIDGTMLRYYHRSLRRVDE